ncbi:2-pyrone-4,6-dicarboxylate hydrolase [Staphylococcus pragensis]|uniref:2-pyrone-4,6-dicarboxylate hydrolase n=1 Tax=Staphylococcus pragensis TaxID=1611836 RepID=A0A4Z1BDF5_9STAP|nr:MULTISPECIES: amidohydrolase family protein [Staphylococcus]RTX92121.1 2-pyrone-4,6-dicarboxylate hydrolase [Staphylococcus carnosus]TGN23200.1 2-pyrone-4,6-dicarboxylate hydrolase [Staphylococcus pragensis]GGG96720.1 2-pyrone-4,6-dicarboxylate hydrolase [Staphylococcus pragensis]
MKIFDAHFHIIDFNFPVKENNGYMPPSFTTQDYLNRTNDLEIIGGAVVSGSFQEFDQDYLVDALHKLDGKFVGTTQLPITTSDAEIRRLNTLGTKGIRFNVKRGGSEDISKLKAFAQRVYDLVGWHTEIYIESKKLTKYKEVILQLPQVSIDHLGLTEEGFEDLKDLVRQGVYVKATGFGRIEIDPLSAIQELININPNAVMFGTDLPSTRANRPFNVEDIQLIQDHFNQDIQERIFYKNALEFYRLSE